METLKTYLNRLKSDSSKIMRINSEQISKDRNEIQILICRQLRSFSRGRHPDQSSNSNEEIKNV